MPSPRLVVFPSARTRCEPMMAEWVTMGWRTLPDGSQVVAETRKELHVRPDGTWTLSVKEPGRGTWTHVTGDAETTALEYFQAMLRVQFYEDGRQAVG